MLAAIEALARVVFSRDEERAIMKLEGTIDETFRQKFDGAPIRLVFNEPLTLKIVSAIQRRYEEGGWKVNVAPTKDSTAFSFVAAPLAGAIVESSTPRKNELPPLAAPAAASTSTQAGSTSTSTNSSTSTSNAAANRLLIRMPTRGRPAQALSVLEKYREMAGVPVTIEVVIDVDDETMTNATVLQRLNALGCVITAGKHESKVEAVNGGRVGETRAGGLIGAGWDVLLLASDDMVPVSMGFGGRVLEAMNEYWPHLDGAIYFDDSYQGKDMVTLPIFGRRLYDQFGCVYAQQYASLFCDTEQTEVLKKIQRLVYIDEKIIEHRHPVTGKIGKDALYERNDAYWTADQKVFEERKSRNFGLPEMRLSILIATLPSRKARLDRLIDHIYMQIGSDYALEVEVLTDNREGISVGAKRQSLLERSLGKFVAFVDDDDWISFDYVERVVGVIEKNPDADCLSLNGILTTSGQAPEKLIHSIKYSEWKDEGDVHLRSINHLNPVRRDLALAAGFRDMGYGEDQDYSRRLKPLLKVEADTGVAPLYLYWYFPGKGATGA